jgi:transposase-like protein
MTEQEQRRGAKHRLAVIRHCEEVTHNVSKTCRYYGISRQCYYRWLERYCEEGEAGCASDRADPRTVRAPRKTT